MLTFTSSFRNVGQLHVEITALCPNPKLRTFCGSPIVALLALILLLASCLISLCPALQDALLTHGQFAAGCLFNLVVLGSSRCSGGVTVGTVPAPYHTHVYIITNFKGY